MGDETSEPHHHVYPNRFAGAVGPTGPAPTGTAANAWGLAIQTPWPNFLEAGLLIKKLDEAGA